MKKVLFFILCLLSVNLYSQRLNSDSLKMVSKLSVDKGYICFDIDFKYDNNKLNQIIFVYSYTNIGVKPHHTDVSKYVLTKDGNNIIQKSYMNGKPDNRYKYDYKFGEDSKLIHFDVLEYTELQKIYRTSNDFIYLNDTILEIQKYTSWIENNIWCYDPGITGNHIKFIDGCWSMNKIYYNLTPEQNRKYAPLYTEDEFNESLPNLNRKDYGTKISFLYSDSINDQMDINRRKYDITYKYDTKGNIVQVDYISKGNFRNNAKIKIEYVPE